MAANTHGMQEVMSFKVGDDTFAIHYGPPPGPPPSRPPPPIPTKATSSKTNKMDAINAKIAELSTQKTETAKVECKKLLYTGKKSRQPCYCKICVAAGAKPPASEAPSSDPAIDRIVGLLQMAIKKDKDYEISAEYAKEFLQKNDNKLALAKPAILKDLTDRLIALESVGRVTYEREKEMAVSGDRTSYDQILTFIENDDQDIKEFGELGPNSALARPVRTWSKSEKEKFYAMYTEEAAFRIRRAEYYKEQAKKMHEGKLTEAQFKSDMSEYDSMYDEQQQEKGKGTNSRSALARSQTSRRASSKRSTTTGVAAGSNDKDEYEDEEAKIMSQSFAHDEDFFDGCADEDYDSEPDSECSLNTRVMMKAGPNATQQEISRIRDEEIDKYKKRLAALRKDYQFKHCPDCRQEFIGEENLQVHLDDMAIQCTGRGTTKFQELEKMRADAQAARTQLDKDDPEAAKAAIQASLRADVDKYANNILTSVLVRAVEDSSEIEDVPCRCDRCDGIFRSMSAVKAHLSKPGACNAFFKDFVATNYLAKVAEPLINKAIAGQSATSQAEASTSNDNKGKKSKKAKSKPLSESLIDIVRKMKEEADEKIINMKNDVAARKQVIEADEHRETTVTYDIGMTPPSFIDDSNVPKSIPSFVDAVKNLSFEAGDAVRFEEYERALTLSPRLAELHQRLKTLWEDEDGELVSLIEEDVIYPIEDCKHVAEICPMIYKASLARTMIGLCGGSAALAVAFVQSIIPEIEEYIKSTGVIQVTLRSIERELNRFAMSLHYENQFGIEFDPELGEIEENAFYFY